MSEKLTKEEVVELAKGFGLTPLETHEFKGIKEKAEKRGYDKAQDEFKPTREESETMKAELDKIKTENMTEMEKKDHDLEVAQKRYDDLSGEHNTLERKSQKERKEFQSERTQHELMSLLGANSADPALSVRECLYQFPELGVEDKSLVLKEGDSALSPKDTAEKIKGWFDEKTILHKVLNAGPSDLPGSVTNPQIKQTTNKFNPDSPELLEALGSITERPKDWFEQMVTEK